MIRLIYLHFTARGGLCVCINNNYERKEEGTRGEVVGEKQAENITSRHLIKCLL